MFNEEGNKSITELLMYRDKDGLPVIYDAATDNRRVRTGIDELSMLWHEILTPLTAIKGYTDTLLELGDDISEEQKKQYLRGIESATNRMLRLIKDLRDISLIDETDLSMIPDVSINDIIRQTVSEMQTQTSKHIIKKCSAEWLPPVKAIPGRIEQVLSNLITNAIKYSPDGGDITVDVGAFHDEKELKRVSDNTPEISPPCLIVSVTDEGVGVPEDELENIFKRFYRVDNRIIKDAPGAGLGLYISQMIVEGHGGRIWARNRSRGGSAFYFSLPLEHKAARTFKYSRQ